MQASAATREHHGADIRVRESVVQGACPVVEVVGGVGGGLAGVGALRGSAMAAITGA